MKPKSMLHLCQNQYSKYLGHTSSSSGDSKKYRKKIDLLHLEGITTNRFLVFGCDWGNVNTGKVGGVILWLKVKSGRPCTFWLVCLMHANDLHLRHMIYTESVTFSCHSNQELAGQSTEKSKFKSSPCHKDISILLGDFCHK